MHTLTRVLQMLAVVGAAASVGASSWALSGYRKSRTADRVHIPAGRPPVAWQVRVMLAAAAAGLTALVWAVALPVVSLLGHLL